MWHPLPPPEYMLFNIKEVFFFRNWLWKFFLKFSREELYTDHRRYATRYHLIIIVHNYAPYRSNVRGQYLSTNYIERNAKQRLIPERLVTRLVVSTKHKTGQLRVCSTRVPTTRGVYLSSNATRTFPYSASRSTGTGGFDEWRGLCPNGGGKTVIFFTRSYAVLRIDGD